MKEDQITGGIFGLAIGDALGVPVEFSSRSERDLDPVEDYRAFGVHSQPEGTWSDDTSLTLALFDSLSSGLDYNDIAQKFLSWKRDNEYTATGRVFDIGIATSRAIANIEQGMDPISCGGNGERSNGNGSLMRILPAAFYVFNLPPETRKKIIFDISSITHAHLRSKIACLLYCELVRNVLLEQDKETAVDSAYSQVQVLLDKEELEEFVYFQRCRSSIKNLPRNEISSKGYVVYSLEASLWCFLYTGDYKSAVLKAVNLGEDTDTTAAITGGLAGCFYGYEGIPGEWKEKVQSGEYIGELTDTFIDSLDNTYPFMANSLNT